MQDRRYRSRCPVCQGPVLEGEGIARCRNSLCSFNHQDIACPRCGSQGPDAETYQSETYHYKCRDCLNRWSEKAGS